jgi:hypothetical protein
VGGTPTKSDQRKTGRVKFYTDVSRRSTSGQKSTPYAHLRIVTYLRSDRASQTDNLAIRFNNDTGANYDYIESYTTGAAAYNNSEGLGLTRAAVGLCPGSNATANRFGTGEMLIGNYTGTTNYKSMTYSSSAATGTTTGLLYWDQGLGHWRSASAINRVQIFPWSGTNWKAGSRLTIYALGV